MNMEERQQRYGDYIENVSAGAAATGRREPYHLTYLREHGDIEPPGGAGKKDDEK